MGKGIGLGKSVVRDIVWDRFRLGLEEFCGVKKLIVYFNGDYWIRVGKWYD